MRSIARVLAKSLITTVIFFLIVEVTLRGAYAARDAMVKYVPLPYAVGDDYGPTPPWLDRLELLDRDPVLIWKSAPNVHRIYVDIFSPVHAPEDRTALLRRFNPVLPEEFRGNHTWELRLNSEGFRGPEFAAAKPARTIRVACIGDSWTFGMNVNQDQTYPARLAEWLKKEHPAAQYEVMNFGTLGYSSFQGLQLLKRRVLDFNPDVLVIGFGMNDSGVSGYRDKDMVSEHPAPSGVLARVRQAAQDLEDYKLLKYVALVLRYRPKPLGDYLKAEADTKGSGTVDYDAMEPWTRVSPRDYERNLREMIGLIHARAGYSILLDNELWAESPYRPVLRKIADDLNVPLVNSLDIISAARANIERDIEERFDLGQPADGLPVQPPDARGQTTVIFRAYRGSIPVPGALSMVGTVPALGSLVPNSILMRDDGTGGDQKAGDGVWSYAVTAPAGSSLVYMYTNSGAPGKWEGLDVPHIRRVKVPASPDGRPVYLPIETFGRVYMQADDWHTDAVGYDMIAHGVAIEIAAPRS